MARMGDWRDNKDIEIPLDGVGGVSIVVKANVHREGLSSVQHFVLFFTVRLTIKSQALISPPTPSRTKPRQKASQRWPSAQAKKCTAYPITSYGTETPTRSPATLNAITGLGKSAFFSLSLPSSRFFVRLFRIDRIFCCLLACFVVSVFLLIAVGRGKSASESCFSASSRAVCLFRSAAGPSLWSSHGVHCCVFVRARSFGSNVPRRVEREYGTGLPAIVLSC